jgi:hypothetical protein
MPATMTTNTPIKVAIATGVSGLADWHSRTIEAVKATPGVLIIGALDTPVRSGFSRTGLPRSSAADADLILDFSGEELRHVAPLGVWRFGFGDGTAAAGGAKGTAARLYRVAPGLDRAVVLHEGWYRAWTPEGWGTKSVTARVAPWCARVLKQLVAGQTDLIEAPLRSIGDCRLLEPPHAGPSLATRATYELQEWFERARWNVGIVPLRIEQILDQQTIPEPAWLHGQSADRFYADPFPLRCDGERVELLVEDYRYASRRKLLSILDLSLNGTLLSDRLATGLPSHASYPFLLRTDGDVVCVPETFRARRLAAYTRQCDGSWVCAGELIRDFPVVDPTLVAHGGLWWLFCMKQGDEDQTDLHLFYASDWRGPWTPHPLNPVKSDTRSSRPAGSCFVADGILFRPAQNCARRYGAGLAINRVRQLSTTRFSEETVVQLVPAADSPWRDGMHTINAVAGITVVDGLRLERRLTRRRAVSPPADDRTGRF